MSKITLKEFEVINSSSAGFPGASRDKKWTTKDFEKSLKIKFIKKKEMELEFDLIGVDASVANAFRRILLSEVPSMAFEKVYIYNNTSIIQDEVLAHRLGLIPLKADPRLFEYKQPGSEDAGTESDTLEFDLKVRCKKNSNAPSNSDNPDELYVDHKVFTDKITWIPRGDQAAKMSCNPGPVHDDILIAKMRPGHEIDVKLYAVKGLGNDHAKFSPVATAFYRLLPEITLNRTVKGEQAERLQSCFSPGVIRLDGSKKKAVVEDPRYDACSRNVYRHEDLKDAVTMNKKRDHFIFTVESVGALEPEDLFTMAIDVLEAKCEYFLKELEIPLSEGKG